MHSSQGAIDGRGAQQPTPPDSQHSAGKARPILFSAPMVRALIEGRKTQTRRLVKPPPHDVVTMVGADDAPTGEFGLVLKAAAPRVIQRFIRCPYGVPGDLLWVREAWATWMHAPILQGSMGGALSRDHSDWLYKADGGEWPAMLHDRSVLKAHNKSTEDGRAGNYVVRPSIHMPRWASRITLRVTDVRVERLQDITEADAIAEGLYRSLPDDEDREWFRAYQEEHTGEPPTQADLDQFEEGVWMAPGVPQGWGMTPAERRRDTWAPTPQFAYRLIWEGLNGPGAWDANPWVWAVSFEVIHQNIDALLAAKEAT